MGLRWHRQEGARAHSFADPREVFDPDRRQKTYAFGSDSKPAQFSVADPNSDPRRKCLKVLRVDPRQKSRLRQGSDSKQNPQTSLDYIKWNTNDHFSFLFCIFENHTKL